MKLMAIQVKDITDLGNFLNSINATRCNMVLL
jgi:hypothetical protein